MSLFNKSSACAVNRGRKRNPRRLDFERFEERLLLATIQVINNNDSGTGSLRQAILTANNQATNPGLDNIVFNILAGSLVISPASALPAINDRITIDGTNTAAGNPGTIQLNGGGQAFDGLTLGSTGTTSSAGSTIQDLNIRNFAGAGIHLVT
jgi:hypothetical protein